MRPGIYHCPFQLMGRDEQRWCQQALPFPCWGERPEAAGVASILGLAWWMDSFVPRPGAGSLQEKGSQVTVTPSLTEGTSASLPSTHLGPEGLEDGMVAQGLRVRDLIVEAGGDTAVCQGVPLRSSPLLTLPLGPAPLDMRCLGCWAPCSPLFLSSGLCVSECGEGATGLVAGPSRATPASSASPPVPRGGSSYPAREVQEVVMETPGSQGLCSSALHLPWLWGPPRVGWGGGWTGREPLRWVRWESEVGGQTPLGLNCLPGADPSVLGSGWAGGEGAC